MIISQFIKTGWEWKEDDFGRAGSLSTTNNRHLLQFHLSVGRELLFRIWGDYNLRIYVLPKQILKDLSLAVESGAYLNGIPNIFYPGHSTKDSINHNPNCEQSIDEISTQLISNVKWQPTVLEDVFYIEHWYPRGSRFFVLSEIVNCCHTGFIASTSKIERAE